MQPVLAHKGKLNLGVSRARPPGHSSEPARGVNAVQAAAEAIAWVAAEARRLRRGGPVRGRLRPALHHRPCRHRAGRHDPQHHPRARRVRHGVAHIPADDPHRASSTGCKRPCRSGDRAGDARGRPGDRLRRSRCELEMPGLSLDRRPRADRAWSSSSPARTHRQGQLRHRGRLYQQAGIPTIVCGPGPYRAGAPARRMDRAKRSSMPAMHSSAGSPTGSPTDAACRAAVPVAAAAAAVRGGARAAGHLGPGSPATPASRASPRVDAGAPGPACRAARADARQRDRRRDRAGPAAARRGSRPSGAG